jgi:hypothetical protein
MKIHIIKIAGSSFGFLSADKAATAYKLLSDAMPVKENWRSSGGNEAYSEADPAYAALHLVSLNSGVFEPKKDKRQSRPESSSSKPA